MATRLGLSSRVAPVSPVAVSGEEDKASDLRVPTKTSKKKSAAAPVQAYIQTRVSEAVKMRFKLHFPDASAEMPKLFDAHIKCADARASLPRNAASLLPPLFRSGFLPAHRGHEVAP